jgi:hypothetical protein
MGNNSLGFVSGNWPTQAAVLPNATLDGKPYIVLQLTPKDCPVETDYIDPATYTIHRVDTVGQISTFADFKKGPQGEIYPSTIVETGPSGVIVATITSVQDNTTVDPSIFAMPSPPASASPAPSAAPSGSP